MARKDTYENYTRDELIDTVLQLSTQVTNLELQAKECSARGDLGVDEKKITEQELDEMSIALSTSGILWGDRLISAFRSQAQQIERLTKIEEGAVEGAVDLEPVRRLIERLDAEDENDIGSSITIAGYAALSTLKSLLAEVAQFRSTISLLDLVAMKNQTDLLADRLSKRVVELANENALLEAQVTSLAEGVGDLSMERAEMKVEMARLREENARMQRTITKAAEEGLSHD